MNENKEVPMYVMNRTTPMMLAADSKDGLLLVVVAVVAVGVDRDRGRWRCR